MFLRVLNSFSTYLHRNQGRTTKFATDLTSSKSIGPLGKFLRTCSSDFRRCGANAYAVAACFDIGFGRQLA